MPISGTLRLIVGILRLVPLRAVAVDGGGNRGRAIDVMAARVRTAGDAGGVARAVAASLTPAERLSLGGHLQTTD